jgi:hypothetical protein
MAMNKYSEKEYKNSASYWQNLFSTHVEEKKLLSSHLDTAAVI